MFALKLARNAQRRDVWDPKGHDVAHYHTLNSCPLRFAYDGSSQSVYEQCFAKGRFL
jgi:hypothetical protein